jgi:alkylhydroperoxidase/carboxymuconolactone decarboxylase family protein YurZ
MDTQDRKQRGAELLERMLGAEYTANIRRAWMEMAPDFDDYVVEFVAGEIWSRPQLDRKTKSLITIAALAAMGRTLALDLNVRAALHNGATRQELVETFLQLAPYAGFPAAWEGLAVVAKVLREEAAAQ